MTITRLVAFTLGIILFTGCSGSTPSADWCYQFDFTQSHYGVAVERGDWIPGTGFSTDESGGFGIQYIHPVNVTPIGIRAYVELGKNIIAPVDVMIAAEVFGLRMGPIRSLVPPQPTVNYYTLVLDASNNPPTGDRFKVEAKSSEQIILKVLEVRGNGVNPFGSSNCDPAALRPGEITVPSGDILDQLRRAEEQLANIDVNLTSPEGVPLLPAETGAAVFGYAKWLTSTAAAETLAGPFAPILSHTGTFLAMQLALFVVYVIVFAGTYLIRWVIWLFKFLLDVISTIAEVVNVVTDFAGGIIGKLLKFVGG